MTIKFCSFASGSSGNCYMIKDDETAILIDAGISGKKIMQYLDEKVLDHVNGSWFHQLDQNNELLTTVWPGKSDLYHATQATLIPYYAPDLSIAPAVKWGKTC